MVRLVFIPVISLLRISHWGTQSLLSYQRSEYYTIWYIQKPLAPQLRTRPVCVYYKKGGIAIDRFRQTAACL